LVSINSEQATFEIDFTNELDSCFQTCTRNFEETCAKDPTSPLCPDDIPRRCNLNCELREQGITLLNENFPLNIEDSILVRDYDNMEIELLSIDKTGTRKYTANLRVTKGEEVEMVSIDTKKSKMVFGVRIDFVSFVASVQPVELNEETGEWEGGEISEPFAGLFGVHEKKSPSFWSRVSRWISNWIALIKSGTYKSPACSSERVGIFYEFPHYEDRSLDPEGFEVSCGANFGSSDPPEQIAQYYREQLQRHGWNITEDEGRVGEDVRGVYNYHTISAIRDGFKYSIGGQQFKGKKTAISIRIKETLEYRYPRVR